ncbi:MAG: copper amine oxidase N-terminal domain-containing protein [Dehalobacterium sp.]
MKKTISGILFALALIFTALPTYAASIQIKVDSVAIASDVEPENMNNRTMVPLRVISENLGAQVNWTGSEVTLSKSDIQIVLKVNSDTAVKNGNTINLDTKPYIKKERVMVPLRFIAETFNADVNYKDSNVTVDTEPLVINGVKVKAVQQEYHMTMGGILQQIKGNTYSKAIYEVFLENKGINAETPASYSWMVDIDTPGAYYKNGQYDFLNLNGNSIQRYDIYTLIESHPAEILAEYPKVLIYDATVDQWNLFSNSAVESLNQLIDTAAKNGFLTVISNTVV